MIKFLKKLYDKYFNKSPWDESLVGTTRASSQDGAFNLVPLVKVYDKPIKFKKKYLKDNKYLK